MAKVAKVATIAATNNVSLMAGHDQTVTTVDVASSEYHCKRPLQVVIPVRSPIDS